MKRILCLLISALIVISSVGVVSFADNNHWAYSYIQGMLESGVVTGDQNGNLNLDNNITRAEFAKTVNKYFGYTVKADTGFNDVAPGTWYYDDMLIAKGTGYMIGDANGNATPDMTITRAEVFVIIARILGLQDAECTFADAASIPDWAKGKIGALQKAGKLSGYEDGTIRANGNITRAEAFVTVSKNERHSLPESNFTATEEFGNTSSMVQQSGVNGTASTKPSGGGGGGGGGGSGGSGSSPSGSTSQEVEVNDLNGESMIAQVYAPADTVAFSVSFAIGNDVYTEKVTAVKNGSVYNVDLKAAIEKIVATRKTDGETYNVTIKALDEDDKVLASSTQNLPFVADIIPAMKNFNGGFDVNTGKYEYTWDLLDGANGYVVKVFKDAELKDVDNEFTVYSEGVPYTPEKAGDSYNPVVLTGNKLTIDFDTDKHLVGNSYYITVVPKVGEVIDTPNADNVKMATAGVAGGLGTKDSPFIIATADQFSAIFGNDSTNQENTFNKNFYLVNDIDLSMASPVYTPNAKTVFTGSLKGVKSIDDFTLENRSINIGMVTSVGASDPESKSTAGGIFYAAVGATITNLTLSGDFISAAADRTGGLVGFADTSVITNITNNINVTGSHCTGGIIGNAKSMALENLINNGNVNASGGNYGTGGVVAMVNGTNPSIKKCINTGVVTNAKGGHTGGIVGFNYGTIVNSYNTGNVTSSGLAGGIAGYNCTSGAEYRSCWNSGAVESKATSSNSSKAGAGGILGGCYLDAAKVRAAKVTDCFNLGTVTGYVKGAAIGNVYGSLGEIKNFYDIKNCDIPLYTDGSGNSAAQITSGIYVIGEENLLSAEMILAALKADEQFSSWRVAGDFAYPQPGTLVEEGFAKLDGFVPPVVNVDPAAVEYRPLDVELTYDENYSLILTWTANKDADSYTVYVNDKAVATGLTEKTYKILTTGTSVSVKVVAVVGDKTYSSMAVAKDLAAISGTGTPEDPYVIFSGVQFAAAFSANSTNPDLIGADKNWVIVSNITLPDGYVPSDVAFVGVLKGWDLVNKEDKMVKINVGDLKDVDSSAVFKTSSSGTATSTGAIFRATGSKTTEIANLAIYGSLDSKANTVGGLVGNTYHSGGSIIRNVENHVTITGTASNVGGIVGQSHAGSITNCHNYAPLAGASVAGIVGLAQSSIVITGCSNKKDATITATNLAGGIVGASYGDVYDSYNLADITGKTAVGGIMARSFQASIPRGATNCWNAGKITATGTGASDSAGGIIGGTHTNGERPGYVVNCFNLGVVSAANAGSAIGLCFADTNTENAYGYEEYNAKVNGFYDTANTNMTVVGGTGKKVVNFAYVVGTTSLDSIKALTTTVVSGSPFNDNTIWTIAEGFEYPQLVAAPYVDGSVENVDPDLTLVDLTVENLTFEVATGVVIDEALIKEKIGKVVAYYSDNSTMTINNYELVIDTVNKSATVTFGEKSVTVTWIVTAPKPEITKAPVSGKYIVGTTASPLTVEAELPIEGDLTYEWFMTTEDTNEGGTSVGTGKSYTPSVDTVGTKYYYVVVTYTGDQVTTTKSAPVDVTVYPVGTILGSGTEDDPYLIMTADQFATIKDGLDKHYKQMANIETVTEPIGKAGTSFTGSYDGNGFEIKLAISSDATTGSFGLFGETTDAKIKNVVTTGTISISNGSADKNTYVGGIVGEAKGKTIISGCINKATITVAGGTPSQVAGIVGRAYSAGDEIYNCINYGSIDSEGRAAGIAGVNNGAAKIYNCANFGNLNGAKAAAGIISWAYGPVNSCYNFGTIESATLAAGIATYPNADGIAIDSCFNAGEIKCSKDAGAIVVYGTGRGYKVTNCYNVVDGILLGTGDTTVEDSYNVTSSDTKAKVVTAAALKDGTVSMTGFEVVSGSSYPYLQLSAFKVPSDFVYGNGGEVTPDATLTSIDVTNKTFEVTTGSVVTEDVIKSKIGSVIATYSDNSTKAVTGYTVAIDAENNKATITFEGKTATVTWTFAKVKPEEGSVIISTADEFISYFSNNSENQSTNFAKTYYLVKDIDLTGKSFVPNTTTVFTGKLLGVAAADDASPTYREINIGTVASEGAANSVTGKISAGGIFHETGSATFSYLTLKGDLTSTATDETGGLVGYASKTVINNIHNYINVSGISCTGGIIGHAASTPLYELHNHASVKAIKNAYGTGGVAALCDGSGPKIENCTNTGAITNNGTGSNVGGVIGFNYGNVTNCYNTGNITSGGLAGGVAGYNCTINVEYKNCWNSGTIKTIGASGKIGAGGIVGGCYLVDTDVAKNVRPAKVIDCFNIGEISGNLVGAAIGNVYATDSTIKNFYDLTNAGMALYGRNSTYQKDQIIENAYVIGVDNVTKDTIKALNFANWKIAGKFEYPQPSALFDIGYEYKEKFDEEVVNAETPVISKAPVAADYSVGDNVKALTVEASVSDEGVLSYEWFVNTTASNEGGSSVGTGASYTPSIDVEGTNYYYVVVTNTNNSVSGAKTATVKSDAVKVTVYAAGVIFGSGTPEDPFIINSAEKFKAAFGENAQNPELINGGYTWAITENLDLAGYAPYDGEKSPIAAAADVSVKGTKNVAGSLGYGFKGTLYGMDAETKQPKKVEINIGENVSHASDSVYLVAGKTYQTSDGGLFYATEKPAKISHLILKGSMDLEGAAAFNAGGLVGNTYNGDAGVTIEYVDNYISIKAPNTTNTGGIVGETGGNTTISYCRNFGAITAKGVGGIVGMAQSAATIKNCSNEKSATLFGSGSAFVGGIVASSYADVIDSYNLANVKGGSAAGIIARTFHNGATHKAERCWNAGTIESTYTSETSAAGGIIGATNTDGKRHAAVINCFNVGTIISQKLKGAAVGASFVNSADKTMIDATVNGFYDITNEGLAIVGGSGVNSISHAYVVGNTTLDEIKNLINVSGSPFADSSIWTIKEGYEYPQLVACPYVVPSTGDDEEGGEVNPSATLVSIDAANKTFEVDADVTVTANIVLEKAGKITATYSDESTKDVSADCTVTLDQAAKTATITYEEKTVSVTWTVKVDPTAILGSGTEADPYIIDTADKFRKIYGTKYDTAAEYEKYLGTEGNPVYFLQTEDIDVNKTYQIQAGKNFYGVYRGGSKDGDVITYSKKNININKPDASWTSANVGLFPRVYGEVSYITTTGGIKTTGGSFGGIAGTVFEGGKITNCENGINLIGEGGKAGGIAGVVYGSVENCINKGEIAVLGANCGGVVGYLNGGEIKNCENQGKVNVGGQSIGGVVGAVDKNAGTVTDCLNKGEIFYDCDETSTDSFSHIGGVVGQVLAGATISKCVNEGEINVDGWYILSKDNGGVAQNIGGVIGYVAKTGLLSLSDSYNTATITVTQVNGDEGYGPRYAGGIIGRIWAGANTENSVVRCWNSGNIVGQATYVGGVVGNIYREADVLVVFDNNFNTAEIEAAGGNVAGIVGNLWDKANGFTTNQIKNSYTTTGTIAATFNGVSNYELVNIYVFSQDPKDALANGTQFATKADMAKLIENEIFSAEVWQLNDSYSIPELIANPYVGSAVELADPTPVIDGDGEGEGSEGEGSEGEGSEGTGSENEGSEGTGSGSGAGEGSSSTPSAPTVE